MDGTLWVYTYAYVSIYTHELIHAICVHSIHSNTPFQSSSYPHSSHHHTHMHNNNNNNPHQIITTTATAHTTNNNSKITHTRMSSSTYSWPLTSVKPPSTASTSTNNLCNPAGSVHAYSHAYDVWCVCHVGGWGWVGVGGLYIQECGALCVKHKWCERG